MGANHWRDEFHESLIEKGKMGANHWRDELHESLIEKGTMGTPGVRPSRKLKSQNGG